MTLTGILSPGAVLVLVNSGASATFKIAGGVTAAFDPSV